MFFKPYIAAAILFFLLSCSAADHNIKDEIEPDYRLYQGKWYEIARLPNPVEDGLICVTMTYEYLDDGVMTVTNRGRSKNDPEDLKTLSGRAWIPDNREPKNIRIQFIWPVTKDYVLLHIDESKGHAILGSPFKHQLWILSRSTSISEEDLVGLIKIAEKNQYKVENIVHVEQSCE